MEKKQLYLKMAEFVATNSFDSRGSKAEEREAKLATELKARACAFFSRVFTKFPDEPERREKAEQPNILRNFKGKSEDYDDYWRGRVEVFVIPDGSGGGPSCVKEITRSWLLLEEYAEETINNLVFDGCVARKKTLIGIDDVRFSQDGGKTWGDVELAVGLEIITGVLVVGYTPTTKKGLETGEIENQLEGAPVFFERLQDDYFPIFSEDDLERLGFAVPKPCSSTSRQALIEGMHVALDGCETALDRLVEIS